MNWNCHPCAFLFSLTNDPFRGTTQLFMGHYTIMKNTIIQEHRGGFGASFNKHAVNVKASTKKLLFFVSTLEQLCIVIVFYSVLIIQISYPLKEWEFNYVLCVSHHTAMFCCHFLEVNTFLNLSLGKVAKSLKEKTPTHNAVLIGA